MKDEVLVTVRGADVDETHRFPAHLPIIVGRDAACSLQLIGRGISRKHASIQVSKDGILVHDSSTNGCKVDGLAIRSGTRLSRAVPTRIELGDFSLRVERHRDVVLADSEPPNPRTPPVTQNGSPNLHQGEIQNEKVEDNETPQLLRGPTVEIRREIHRSLLEHLDLRALDRARFSDPAMRPKVLSGLRRIVAQLPVSSLGGINAQEVEMLVQELADEALGLGPLEKLLADPDVSEIMVVDPHTIYVERCGKLTLSPYRFTDDDSVRSVIERIVTPLGRRIDESTPLVDARLKDGSRVNAVIPPLALKGPCITIRKFAKEPLRMPDLVRFGSVTEAMARFLENSVKVRRNIVISGGTGSGKTTLLNVLSAAIPESERVVTVEDAAELQMAQPHVVSLESRPPNLEGKGEYSIRDLVKNALRMRPDRIVVGECRGGEALDMLQAMNTGHEGSLTTTHANSPREAIARIETLCLMAGLDLPVRAIRQQIASSIHLVVQQTRFSDGSRRIRSIAEVVGIDDDGEVELRHIYDYDESDREFLATGYIPSFIGKFVDANLLTEGSVL